ncbi:MAG: cation:proton antiporter [Granulosicoccaceae bacterium]
MSHEVLLGVLAAFIAYSLLSRRVEQTVITLPMIFMVLGYLLSEPLHAGADPELLHSGKRLLAEVTLVLVLFTDACHVRFAQLRSHWQLPTRMLLVGMPLTIALGTLFAYWLNPASGLAVSLLTAAVLTPTDAALGQTVVSSPDVPTRLSQTINIESGLNDGLALPFVLLGAILASAGFQATDSGAEHLAAEILLQLALGPLVGVALGWGLAKAMDWAEDRDAMAEPAAGVVFISAAFIAFVLAEVVGGNGFIAAFVAGMVFGNTYRHDIHFITEFMEGAGQLLTMSSFLIFGAFLLPDGLTHMTWQSIVLALLMLTIVRMLPIYLSLTGTGLASREKLFLGWFGPRGLASILFTLIMMDEFEFPREEELLACVSMTVMFSIVLHGLSATPLAKRISTNP